MITFARFDIKILLVTWNDSSYLCIFEHITKYEEVRVYTHGDIYRFLMDERGINLFLLEKMIFKKKSYFHKIFTRKWKNVRIIHDIISRFSSDEDF